MRKLILVLCILLLSGISPAQDPPKTMTKVEVRLQSPNAPEGSFAAQPKVMYRSGTRYCRIEEAADPENGVHGVAIINEPDYWMVNLMTKTARHGVDAGPSLVCRLPIFADPNDKSTDDPKNSVSDLEFGKELDYFKSKGATPRTGPVLQTKQTTAYRLEMGATTLMLFTYGPSEFPLAVVRKLGDKNEIFWYSGYGLVSFDPKLFAKPEGVKIEEVKP